MDLKLLLALISGKLVQKFVRIFGHGGTSIPGIIVRKIDKKAINKISSRYKNGRIFITGTNGKTTTTSMVKSILKFQGYKVANNVSGANLMSGIITTLLDDCNLLGKPKSDILLLEVDEATIPKASKQIKPDIILVTNIFRDQLDRYTEIDTTLSLIEKGIGNLSKDGKLILNADDPRVASIGNGHINVIYYGVEDPDISIDRGSAMDVQICDNCGTPYVYTRYVYAHLGEYKCPICGQSRPKPDIILKKLIKTDIEGSRFIISSRDDDFEVNISLPGMYNIYNSLAAITVARVMGIDPDVVQKGLVKNRSAFGRSEIINVKGRKIIIFLVKNPTGYNQVINTISNIDGDKYILMALNDKFADGRDVSWIWDVDFEKMADFKGLKYIISSGIRAEELALRLKYADIRPRAVVQNNMELALEEAIKETPEDGVLYILPTYTCMLEIRNYLQRSGYVKPYWEG